MSVRSWFALLAILGTGSAHAAEGGLVEGVQHLENPSFEDHEYIKKDRDEVFETVPGWISPLEHIELHDGKSGSIEAYDGRTKLGLDGELNSGIYQDVPTEAGARYRLELHYAPRSKKKSKKSKADSADVEVDWRSEPLDLLRGSKRYWRRHVYDLQADDDLTRLEFRAAGDDDGEGGFLDGLELTRSWYRSGNLMTNGSFEEPDLGHKDRRVYSTIPGWEATSGGIELNRDGRSKVEPHEAETLLALDGKYGDTVTQVLDLVPGQHYDLEIHFSPRRPSAKDPVEVWWDGAPLGLLVGREKVWHRRRFAVAATRRETELTLRMSSKRKSEKDDDDDDDDDDGGDVGDGGDAGAGWDADDGQDHGQDPGHGGGSDGPADPFYDFYGAWDDDDDDDDDDDAGALIDDVRLYGACRSSDDLVENGSFERHDKLRDRDQDTFPSIPGWAATWGGAEIHRYGADGRSLMAAEGIDHLALGGEGASVVVQDLVTEPGARYELLLAYSPEDAEPGAEGSDVTIGWDGEPLATLRGDEQGWQHHRFVVAATGELTELSLAAPNEIEGEGGQIDEVRLFRIPDLRIISEPLDEIDVESSYAYQPEIAASGADGLRFTLVEAPDGMVIDADTGLVNWDAPVLGEHLVTVQVAGPCDDVESQSFTLSVIDANRAPEIVSMPVTQTQLFAVRPVIRVTDAHPGTEFIELDGEPFLSQTPVSADGNYRISVEATDAAGNTSQVTFEFTIDRDATP